MPPSYARAPVARRPGLIFRETFRPDVRAGDAVVPTQSILVKNAPELAQPGGKCGEK